MLISDIPGFARSWLLCLWRLWCRLVWLLSMGCRILGLLSYRLNSCVRWLACSCWTSLSCCPWNLLLSCICQMLLSSRCRSLLVSAHVLRCRSRRMLNGLLCRRMLIWLSRLWSCWMNSCPRCLMCSRRLLRQILILYSLRPRSNWPLCRLSRCCRLSLRAWLRSSLCRMRLLTSLWRNYPSPLLHVMHRAGIFLRVAISCWYCMTAGRCARGLRWIKALILNRALCFFLWVVLQDDGGRAANRADVIVRSVTASWTLFHFRITIIFLYLIDRKAF